LLVHLGLASYWRGTICSPLVASWERFIGEYQLRIEITMFKLGGKQHLFLQVGSLNEKRHPLTKPADTWAMALRSGSYPVPKLRISLLSMWFASAVAELDLDLCQHSSIESVERSSDSEEEQSEVTSSMNKYIKENVIVAEIDPVLTSNLPADEFPLLSSLGIHSKKHMDSLIQEIVKFNMRKVIKYMQANNRIGFLLPIPSSQNTERFLVEFGK
jgi:hypothetical protein